MRTRWAELRAVQRQVLPMIQAEPAPCQTKALFQQIGELALAAHAAAETAVIVLAATTLTNQAHHVGGAIRKMYLQPLLEEPGDFQRQAQQHVADGAGAGIPGGFEQSLQLHVVDLRNHRRAQGADRHPRLVQGAHGAQSRCGGRGARLHDAFEFVIQGGQAEGHADQVVAGQLAEQVEVAQDQRALGDDVQRMLVAQQDFQRLAGQALFALDGLVGIGIDAQGDGLRYVAGLLQLLFEALGQVGLGNQTGLEIDAGRHIPVGMGRTGEAVDAGVLI